MKNANDGHALLLTGGDQRILLFKVVWHIFRGKIGAVAKGFLHINHNQAGFHAVSPWAMNAFDCGAWFTAARNQSQTGIDHFQT
jgi:hypothetical protein